MPRPFCGIRAQAHGRHLPGIQGPLSSGKTPPGLGKRADSETTNEETEEDQTECRYYPSDGHSM